MGLILLIIGLLLSIFWIYMLISAAMNPRLGTGEKIAWVLIVLFLHILGAALYYFLAHSRR